MGDSPFFTTSASEFFIPLARAVFMTSNASSSPPRAIPMPGFMSPACCARPLARLSGFECIVGDMCPGGKPPGYYMPPRHPAGLSSCRGSCRGGISTRLQSERSYLRSKVPDGVSHLFPCTAGALFPEANSLLLPPHRTNAPHYAAPQNAGLSSCRGSRRGEISQPRACGVPQQ